ncbi:MAG: hypothetical protein KGL39_25405 [Patescibacteria group bacterium]|nr:hypothetical protein [Patescibacteria group bacterium]
MKTFLTAFFICFGIEAFCQVPPPPAASQAEVNTGTVKSKYVSPATLAGWVTGGGETNSASFVISVMKTNNAAGLTNSDGAWQLSSNQVVQGLPFVVLHNNKTATIFTNGYYTGSPTIYSWPSSLSGGFNEVYQLMTPFYKTNSPNFAFTLQFDSGVFNFQTNLIVTCSSMILGSPNGGTILKYNGQTNTFTVGALTNAIVQPSTISEFNAPFYPYSLLSVQTNGIMIPNSTEAVPLPQVTIKDITLTTLSNFPCIGIQSGAGDRVTLENVVVGGNEFMVKPPYYNMFHAYSLANNPMMIGFITGDGQTTFTHCSAQDCQIGLIAYGDSFIDIDKDCQFVSCGNFSGNNPLSSYPNTSELYLGAGILIDAARQPENMTINNTLFFGCYLPIFDNSSTDLRIINPRIQNSAFGNNSIGMTSGSLIHIDLLLSPIYGLVVTNGASGNYAVDQNANDLTSYLSILLEKTYGAGPNGDLGFSVYMNNQFEYGLDDNMSGAQDFVINPRLPLTATMATGTVSPTALSAGTTFGNVDIPTNTLGTHGYSGYMTNGVFKSTGTY